MTQTTKQHYPKFVLLISTLSGLEVLVNIDHIQMISTADGVTVVTFAGSEDYIKVKETPGEIYNQMRTIAEGVQK